MLDKFKENSPLSLVLNIVIMSVIGGAVIWGFFNVFLPSVTDHGETIKVPDVDSLSYDQAISELQQAGLRFEIEDSSANNYNPDLPPMTVLSHTPTPGAKVKNNRRIYLTLNPTNPPIINMPQILGSGSSLKNAYVLLENSDLRIGRIKRVPDYVISGGEKKAIGINNILKVFVDGEEVTEQQILEGYKISKGASVDLEVGDGLGGAKGVVPNVYGLSEREAKREIVGAGFSLGKIRVVKADENVDSGSVIRQSPHSDSGEFRYGSRVQLWVAE
ncbi:PASTA domain-containing protein [Sediminitomix flava]|uniref:PASTA domain-containing protein n=1 Tax=Sediminitomix flava TaxID=379075 RepID=A0A315ZW41_SEDFL|nr:PASTA domain-containing protein [Sediminitomix flava]PWJ40893.1 PASTA domain-containing protein [Sediminitomix flava]